MKVDLQMHSTYSDGYETPQELVELAVRYGLTHIALTDHDTVAGLDEVLRVGNERGIVVVPGIELTTEFQGATLHILGYAFDRANEELRGLCDELYNKRKQVYLNKLDVVNKTLRGRGLPEIDSEDFVQFQGSFFGLGKIIKYCMARGIAATSQEAAALWRTGKKIIMHSIDARRAIDVIHAAVGVAVLSHPFAPKTSLSKIFSEINQQDAAVRQFKEWGLDGIECYQPSHGVEDVEHALLLAHELDLLITGGTDWHGPIEVTGEQIREYIPHYVDHIGDLAIPQKHAERMVERLT